MEGVCGLVGKGRRVLMGLGSCKKGDVMLRFFLGVVVGGVIATMSPWAYENFLWMGKEAQGVIQQTQKEVDN